MTEDARESHLSFIGGFMVAHEPTSINKTFDWDKAATLIIANPNKTYEAGLQGDWNYTGGTIWSNGKICDDSYTYLTSDWAIPSLYCVEDNTMVECYREAKDDPSVKWPESARMIVNPPKYVWVYINEEYKTASVYDTFKEAKEAADGDLTFVPEWEGDEEFMTCYDTEDAPRIERCILNETKKEQ